MPALFVGRDVVRDEQDPVQAQLFLHGTGDHQMPVVDGIEGPSKDAQALTAHGPPLSFIMVIPEYYIREKRRKQE